MFLVIFSTNGLITLAIQYYSYQPQYSPHYFISDNYLKKRTPVTCAPCVLFREFQDIHFYGPLPKPLLHAPTIHSILSVGLFYRRSRTIYLPVMASRGLSLQDTTPLTPASSGSKFLRPPSNFRLFENLRIWASSSAVDLDATPMFSVPNLWGFAFRFFLVRETLSPEANFRASWHSFSLAHLDSPQTTSRATLTLILSASASGLHCEKSVKCVSVLGQFRCI